jgi:hypothetical protein
MLIFVWIFVTVTVALGTIAPDWSFTLPVIVAVSCWAKAVNGLATSHVTKRMDRSGSLDMTQSPGKVVDVAGTGR